MEPINTIDKIIVSHLASQMALGLTALNGMLLYIQERPKSDYITFLVTSLIAIDSIATPLFAGGKSLHDMLGLSPNHRTELEIKYYATWTVTAANSYLFIKYLLHRMMS